MTASSQMRCVNNQTPLVGVTHSLRGDIAGTLDAEGQKRGNRGHGVLATTHRMVAFGEYSDDGSASAMKARDHKDATDLVVTHSLRGEGFDASEDGTGRGTPLVPVYTGDGITADPITAHEAKTYTHEGSQFRLHNCVGQSVTYAPEVAGTMVARSSRGGGQTNSPGHQADKELVASHTGVAPSLTASNDPSRSPQLSEVTQQVWAVMQATQAIGFDAFNQSLTGDVSKALNTGQDCDHVPNVLQVVAFDTFNQSVNKHTSQTIKSPQGAVQESVGAVLQSMQVRRLTPRECERLQGFPDDYTLLPNKGKPAADGPRYKALGNSMAVPVMRWIGERIFGLGQK